MTTEQRDTMRQEALDRARFGRTYSNYPAIIAGFAARGIAENEILPRENVFTFEAWRALGRHVRKGEHGVRVQTYLPIADRKADPADNADNADNAGTDSPAGEDRPRVQTRPRIAYVFHVSQTDADTAAGTTQAA